MSKNEKKFVAILTKLHELIDSDGDGKDADGLRDQMDALWLNMSAEEQHFAQKLSSDLYDLNEQEKERMKKKVLYDK